MNRITESNVKIPNPITEQTASVSNVRTKSAETSKAVPAGEDQVVTDTQTELQSLSAHLSDPVRASRVDSLRSLIKSGQYVVDSVALSGSIIDSLLKGY